MKVKGGWGLFVVVLAVVLIAAALIMPVVAGAVARAGDGSTAVVCQSDFACGGTSMAWNTPTPAPVVCQSGTACGG